VPDDASKIVQVSSGWSYGGWGLLGGLIVDGLEFYSAVRANKGKVPVAWKRPGTYVAELIRVGVGGILAAATGMSGQIGGPIGALSVGAAAPLLVEKLSQGLLREQEK
jgi:hypothetical protein